VSFSVGAANRESGYQSRLARLQETQMNDGKICPKCKVNNAAERTHCIVCKTSLGDPGHSGQMKRAEQDTENPGFLFIWIAANAVAFLVGMPISWMISSQGPANDPISILSGAILGIVVGIAQCFALQGQIRGTGWWILATVLGASIGHAITKAVHDPAPYEPGPPPLFVALSITGVTVGVLQWIVLLRQLRWSVLWILVSAIGFTLGLVPLVFAQSCLGIPLLALGGGLYGAITGGTLNALKGPSH
jgi:hypothetical protein